MAKVGIVTDSTNCLPRELIEKHGIRVASFRLIIGKKDYRDQIDITPAEFWKMFKTLKELPTTSAVTPGDYEKIFRELAKSTNEILCIGVASKLTVANKCAGIARDLLKNEYPDLKIEIVDSQTSVGALGFIVLEAARAAEQGKGLGEVTQIAKDFVPRVKYLSVFKTLKYLIRGGRAPKIAFVGEFLHVKPIIGLTDGTGVVQSLGKERGQEKAWLKIVDMVKDYTDTNKPLHLMVHYTDSIKDGETVKEMLVARYNCTEVYLTDLTPVMTTHTGPMVGISFYS